MFNDITNTADLIDIRDVIERYEELEGLRDAQEEFRALGELLDDLKGYGGDVKWRGDWYPISLIRDSYFREYAEGLAEDIGAIDRALSWPHSCIDWERAARELQMDYSAVTYGGVTYWYR